MDSRSRGHSAKMELVDKLTHPAPATGEPTVPETIARPSFSALYNSHFDAIWRFLERLGVHDHLLEDAAQDVFLVAHRQLAHFRGASSVRTWLHAIAHKVAKDYRRRDQRKGGLVQLEATVADQGRSPLEEAAARQQLARVLRLLDQMEETQRTVFVLTEFEGMTAPEVAEVTGAGVNTVSSRLRAARQRFNELVKETGGAE